MSAKNRITVNLDDDEYEELQTFAAKSDRSLAWLGRRAIADLLVKERRSVGSQTQAATRPTGDPREGSERGTR